jgi:type I restriction enzyme S subunit
VNIRKFSIDFLEYVVSADAFYEQILLMVTGTAQYNVSSNQVQSTKISLPPLDEQAAIVTHLKNEVSHIDAVISKVESAIAGLVEYRSALISAAVTGKIDVRQGG